MTHEDAFLQAIAEAPDDDAPRLIYADWLDDHGEPAFADFIRVQCEIARLCEENDRWLEWKLREEAIWKELVTRWAEPFRVLHLTRPKPENFQRGLLRLADATIEPA